MTSDEINAVILGKIKTKKKPRKNWAKEFKKERNKTIDEAIAALKSKMRGVPIEWHRGYNSAITTMEIMKKMNWDNIEGVEAKAQKAVTELAELAIEHSKDAARCREKYRSLLIEKNLYLQNFADGVDGHYCIARYNELKRHHEFFNIEQGIWCSGGTVLDLGCV